MLKRASRLFYVAGVFALVAAVIVISTGGFLPRERFRAGFYFFWAAVMFAFGYRSQQKGR